MARSRSATPGTPPGQPWYLRLASGPPSLAEQGTAISINVLARDVLPSAAGQACGGRWPPWGPPPSAPPPQIIRLPLYCLAETGRTELGDPSVCISRRDGSGHREVEFPALRSDQEALPFVRS